MKGFVSRRTLISSAVAIGTVGAFGGVASSSALANGLTLHGAGSTLVQPLEAEWATAYNQQTGNTISYAGVGSGTGITDISNRLVDFGASDAPLTPAQASACNSCVQIPWALSATGVGFNIPGVKSLKLTGAQIASIYLGQTTNWNQISKKLPNLKITPIFRSDGSGDTYAFTNYLSKVSGTWASKVSFATSVQFPTGVGGSGNSGVASLLKSTSGGIAYVAVPYLLSQQLNAASVQNAAGNYEVPNLANIENAAQSVTKVPATNELHIVDPGKKQKIAYPISTFTYAIVPKSGNKQLSFVKAFINYALGGGQHFGAALDFAPLPKIVLKADKATVKTLS